MTEVRYEDRFGNEAMLQDFYKVVEQKGMTQNEVIKNWFGEVNEKEQQLTEHVERNGGKVLSIVSQPISKRRYKRKVYSCIYWCWYKFRFFKEKLKRWKQVY